MGRIFIVNEWLWSDSNGDNGEEKQKEALEFLETLFKKCDRLAVAKGSKFQQKEWNFSKNAACDIKKREIAKLYFSKIKSNSQKYVEIDIEKIEKKEEYDLADIKPDDIYLIKTYYKTKGLIISTDNKLINSLKAKDIPCKLRDEFLKEYLL